MKHKITNSHLQSLIDNRPIRLKRKDAIKKAIKADTYPYCFHVLRQDGAIEIYRGTSATKQGYWKQTLYPEYMTTKSDTYSIINQ